MRIHNHNEAITQLSMPERQIPVLLPCDKAQRDGFTALGDVSPNSISVRRLPQSALESFLDPRKRERFESRYGPVPTRERERLLYVLGLAEALSRRDAKDMRKVVRNYVSDSEYEDIVWDEVRKSPLYELHRNFNRGMRGTRFVVWWADRERRLAPGVLAEDPAGALSALMLSGIGRPGGLGVCQRVQCLKPFIRERGATNQKYCTDNCQAAAGMARFRAKRSRKLRKRR